MTDTATPTRLACDCCDYPDSAVHHTTDGADLCEFCYRAVGSNTAPIVQDVLAGVAWMCNHVLAEMRRVR